MIQKKVLLVDDHDIFNVGMKVALEKDPFFIVVGESRTGEHALKLIAQKKFDLVICDYLLPNLNGINVLIEAKKITPDIKTILISSKEKFELQTLCKKHKIDGYIFKSEVRNKIVDVANLIFNNHTYRPLETQKVNQSNLLSKLTTKEMETLRYWVLGKTMEDTGAQMKINIKTVESHRNNIKKKLTGLTKEKIFALMRNYEENS